MLPKEAALPHFQESQLSPAPPPLLVEHLSVSYGGKLALFVDFLSLPARQILALIGPSGCGKTSFLLACHRLTDCIPECRVEGKILLFGEPLLTNHTPPQALRKRVGFLFQKPTPFPISIWKNLAFPLREHGVGHRKLLGEKIEWALESVGLLEEVKDRLHENALSLSGGQQQRLCLARAIALDPELLLLDEPTSSLDPIAARQIEELLLKLRSDYTICLATHNLSQARRLSDLSALFWIRHGHGELIELAPTETFFEAPQNSISAAYIAGERG